MSKNQMYRFCCSCIRISLITENGCHFCGGKFIVASLKDDLKIRKKKELAESY
mgnify:CR=1 FL=1